MAAHPNTYVTTTRATQQTGFLAPPPPPTCTEATAFQSLVTTKSTPPQLPPKTDAVLHCKLCATERNVGVIAGYQQKHDIPLAYAPLGQPVESRSAHSAQCTSRRQRTSPKCQPTTPFPPSGPDWGRHVLTQERKTQYHYSSLLLLPNFGTAVPSGEAYGCSPAGCWDKPRRRPDNSTTVPVTICNNTGVPCSAK
jgi:hypothetical protein